MRLYYPVWFRLGRLRGKPRRSSVVGKQQDRGREPPLGGETIATISLPQQGQNSSRRTHIPARGALWWRFPRQLRVDRYREECSAILTTTAISHCCSPAMRPVACGR